MRNLTFFYEHFNKFEKNNERKISLSNLKENKILIKGAKFSGKRALLRHFLADFNEGEFLFIDTLDARFNESCLTNLADFLKQNPKIKILCIANYNENLNLNFKNLNTKIILTSFDKSLEIAEFREIELDFCDFEELITSSKKTLSVSMYFNYFLQNGRSVLSLNQALLNLSFTPLELEILKYLAQNLGSEISILQLFNKIKQSHKSSKDSVFKSLKKLENEYVIFTLKHDTKELKKIYFRDFGLKNALNYQKNFNALFENLILNELFKLKTCLNYNKIFHFYSLNLKTAYICAPTLDKDLIILQSKKILPKALELGIFHIYFISLSNHHTFFEQGIKFEILPFDEWALSF